MPISTYRKKGLFVLLTKSILMGLCAILIGFTANSQEMDRKTGLIRGSNYNPAKKQKGSGTDARLGGAGSSGFTKWGFGIKGGMNMTTASPDGQYSVFSFTEEPLAAVSEKAYYKSSENKGFQVTFVAKYTLFGGLSLSIQPTFASYTYGYTSSFAWIDNEDTNNSLFLNFNHEQSLNYIEVPLLVRYEILNTPIRPFVHGGAFYGKLLSALKDVEVTGTDNASGGTEDFNGGTNTIGIKDQFKPAQYGLVAGGGVILSVGPANVELGVDYKLGMSNIVDSNNRFEDNTLISGSYDILDNAKLKNISFSMGVIFGF